MKSAFQLLMLWWIVLAAVGQVFYHENDIDGDYWSGKEVGMAKPEDKMTKYKDQPLFQHFTNQIEKIFIQFIDQHQKPYTVDSDEYQRRLKIFTENWIDVHVHNSKPGKWKKGINQFSDMTKEEWSGHGKGRLNLHRPTAATQSNLLQLGHAAPIERPKEKDWRKEGIITAVKNQGACGSCWAHSATEQLESYLKLGSDLHVPLTNLSVQQITSCTPNTLKCGGEGGCTGGVEQFAYSYAQFMGIVTEEDYPYLSGHNDSIHHYSKMCLYDPSRYGSKLEKPIAFTRGQETLPHNNYEAVMDHLAFRGPLAISVAANDDWKSYESGVFDGCSYTQNMQMNHAVQLVGYGTDEDEGNYWLVRNSWGESWGENGYIRLLREDDTRCGLDTTPLDGTACKHDGVKVQKVCGMCGVLFEASYPIGTTNGRSEVVEPSMIQN